MKKINSECKERLRKTVIKYLIILGIALAYLTFVLCTGLRIPCVLYELTGIKCPGCGITRMFVSLARLDFAAAFSYNQLIFITGPFILAYLLCSEAKYVFDGNRRIGRFEIFLPIELFLLIAFGVLRNIFRF